MLVYNKLQCVFTVYFNCFVQRVCKHSFSCEKASQKKDVFSQPLSPAFLNLLICPLSPPPPFRPSTLLTFVVAEEGKRLARTLGLASFSFLSFSLSFPRFPPSYSHFAIALTIEL